MKCADTLPDRIRGLETLLTDDSGLNLSLMASRTRLLNAQWKQNINTP